jgi:spermidine synthase
MTAASKLAPSQQLTHVRTGSSSLLLLFLASALTLFFELVVIRYLSSQIRVFAYLQNLPLIASFLGIGLGMALGRAPRPAARLFPLASGALFLLTSFAERLHLTHIAFPTADNMAWGNWTFGTGWHALLDVFGFFLLVLGCLALIVLFFVVLGGFVGEQLSQQPPLLGYALNLAGSFAGILLFTLLSFCRTPPAVWLLIGFVMALPFFWKSRTTLLAFVVILAVVGWPATNVYWSPYYRISIDKDESAISELRPERYWLSVNYDYHQRILDLDAQTIAQSGSAPNYLQSLAYYDVPYRLALHAPSEVMIVGAGTGNDVAAALRNGVTHVDAVEIDPVILGLGRQLHPERPYASQRVTVYEDDARAFFQKAKNHYDLIVFGFLDSHTLMSAHSSLRLDNYVYTLQSFLSAKSLLKPDGIMVLSFASGHDSYVTRRMFVTLSEAFKTAPRTFYTGYDSTGVTFVEGAVRDSAVSNQGYAVSSQLHEITGQLEKSSTGVQIATDNWPFLYLQNRRIPVATLWSLILFLYCAEILLNRTLKWKTLLNRSYVHFLLLGAAFLLLETKAVTELSLVFGSTWIVNAVVIAGFLGMALLANTVVMFRRIPYPMAYAGLFLFLAVSILFPYHVVMTFSPIMKVITAGAVAALPVFFSGLIFSTGFSTVANSSQTLGVNLFGAVAGGVLENTVTMGGIPLLGVLAVVLYAFSAVCLRKT